MAKTSYVYSLDVGQGMATFVEHYEDDQVMANALTDLGSTKSKSTAGPPTIEFLKQRIIARAPPDGYIDAVFLSHKDADHVNLIEALLKALPKAKIGVVRYGGRYTWYKKSVGNILDSLGERTSDANSKVKGFSIGDTGWNAESSNFTAPLWSGSGYAAYLMIANTPYGDEVVGSLESTISSEPDGDQANSKSLVLLFDFGGYRALIGGDATFPTFQYVNKIFATKLLSNLMTLLPHHGSRKTTYGLSATNAEISSEAREVVATYAERMNGATVVASADRKHDHPSLETINQFLGAADFGKPWWSDSRLAGNMHYVTARIDLTLSDLIAVPMTYTTFQSRKNVYSTLYFYKATDPQFSYSPFKSPAKPADHLVSFSLGMNYFYKITPDAPSKFTLTGVPNNRLDDALLSLRAGLAFDAFAPAGSRRSESVQRQKPAQGGGPRAPAQVTRSAPRLATVR